MIEQGGCLFVLLIPQCFYGKVLTQSCGLLRNVLDLVTLGVRVARVDLLVGELIRNRKLTDGRHDTRLKHVAVLDELLERLSLSSVTSARALSAASLTNFLYCFCWSDMIDCVVIINLLCFCLSAISAS